MATVTHHRPFREVRSGIQKVCAVIGVGFLLVGVAGLMNQDLLGMHLSIAHNIIHLASGALALWVAMADDPKKAFTFSIVFGSVYGLLGLLGFVIGQPGYPAVGHLASDQNLLRVIPNVLEFGTNDHAVHLFLSAILISSGLSWRKRVDAGSRALVAEQGRVRGKTTRPMAPNSMTDLPDAELGQSDVNRPSDLKRRSDFERRL